METKSSYDLIIIGLLIRFFRTLSDLTKIVDVNKGLKGLETGLQNAGFEVSYSGIVNLDALKTIRNDLKDKSPDENIGQDIQKRIIRIMESIENIVYSEAQTKQIYIIPQRRYNMDYLLNHPADLLKPSVFSKLSDIAQFDFVSSCHCLIFGESTASAFHILRATEDTLKQFYFKYIKTKRLSKPMWGPMVTALRAKKNNKPDSVILDSLDLIRATYRNPTQHPEATYDIDSVQDLFGVCIDILNKMVLEIS